MALGEVIKKFIPFTGRGLRDDDSVVNVLDYLTRVDVGAFVRFADSGTLDAFSRLRISEPTTLFDSQQEYGIDVLSTWDIAANGVMGDMTSTSGSVANGGSLVGPTDMTTSMTPIRSGSVIGDMAILQSRQYVRYIPAKSQLIFITGVFAESASDPASFILRSSTSGVPAEREIHQAEWNLDPLDGTGPSGVAIDFTTDQILVIDAQWLSAGRLRIGFDINGTVCYAHEYLNANVIRVPYTQTFNLPIRLESETKNGETEFSIGYFDKANGILLRIRKPGQGGEFKFICCSVQSEGGQETRGFPEGVRNDVGRSITAATPVLAIRNKVLYNGRDNRIHTELIDYLSFLSGGDCNIDVVIGGTVAGGTWVSVGDSSALEVNRGGTTITGGRVVRTGFGASGTGNNRGSLSQGETDIRNPFVLSQIDDLPARQIEMAIVVTPFSGTVTARAAFNWNEQRI